MYTKKAIPIPVGRHKRRVSSSGHDGEENGVPVERVARRSIRNQTRKSNNTGSHQELASQIYSPVTPRKSRKKARFTSQPQHELETAATGLTPAISRTSLTEDPGRSRQVRRRSAPAGEGGEVIDPIFPIGPAPGAQTFQFTPIRQIIDSRTQRRIRRAGLSHEINVIEQENRDAIKRDRRGVGILSSDPPSSLDAELQTSRDDVETESQVTEDEEMADDAPGVQEMDVGLSPRQDMPEAQFCETNSHGGHENEETELITIGDSIMGDDTLLQPSSPVFPRNEASWYTTPCSPSRLNRTLPSKVDASAQTANPCCSWEEERNRLSLEVEAARKEKRELFKEWRANVSSANNQNDGDCQRPSTPPSDFMSQIIPSLKAAVTRSSAACQALAAVRADLADMGFSGHTADEIIRDMRHAFRSARLELERAMPGETANTPMENGHATLDALVERVKILANDLQTEQGRHEGSLGREKALRGQFDASLTRCEVASKKIRELEESIEANAGDMLHARMQIQQLEKEGVEKDLGIDRLNAASRKYHEEVQNLESIVSSLEAQVAASKTEHHQTISHLEQKISVSQATCMKAESIATERQTQIDELQETIEQNRIRVCDLTAQVECMENEQKELAEAMATAAATHQQEVGSLNVRLSELITSLEASKSEIARLQRHKSGLETRCQIEVEARERTIRHVIETINAEARGAKVRDANWKIKSDEIDTEPMMPGSEPITPVSVGRFVNVRVERGKRQRRRPDSGIDILSEESDQEGDEGQTELTSDFDLPAIPTSDIIDVHVSERDAVFEDPPSTAPCSHEQESISLVN